jgi:hypothetical protein
MDWFEKQHRSEENRVIAELNSQLARGTIIQPKEEWVWITGYKGTDKNMQCRGYQYEMNVPFHIPDYEEVSECRNGFHLCKKLVNVFGYYSIGSGNRFFEVRALVRKSDAEKNSRGYLSDKIAAKSIEFIRELDVDEILTAELSDKKYSNFPEFDLSMWSDEAKKMAIDVNVYDAFRILCVDHLGTLGYSRPFAQHIMELGVYNTAVSVGAQKDLSMDMKAMFIYNAVQREYVEREHRRCPRYRSYSDLRYGKE